MKINKLLILLLLLVIVTVSIIGLNKINNDNKINYSFSEKKAEDLNPISKDSAKKVLQAEYGMEISNNEEDFKIEGNYYTVDVYISIKNEEEHTHTGEELETNSEGSQVISGDIHKVGLGIHKINLYTGKLIKD